MQLDGPITAAVAVVTFLVGAWKFMYNHIDHVKSEILEEVAALRTDLREVREYLFRQR